MPHISYAIPKKTTDKLISILLTPNVVREKLIVIEEDNTFTK